MLPGADILPVFNLSVEREHVQKKTFTKWVNSHLCRINCRVVDLYTDLRDGKLLIKLLEILSGERLVRTSQDLRSEWDWFRLWQPVTVTQYFS